MNLPRLSRLLLYFRAPKYREKIAAMERGSITDSVNAGMIAKVRQRGKDQQSLEAAKIGKLTIPITIGRGEYINEPFDAFRRLELQEIRHSGEKQQLHAYMNVLKCHIAHLEEIVARQGEELKRLR